MSDSETERGTEESREREGKEGEAAFRCLYNSAAMERGHLLVLTVPTFKYMEGGQRLVPAEVV